MKPSAKHTIEIEYFPVYGRAEPVKMMMAYYCIPFTEKCITGEEWGALKANKDLYAFGCLPVAVVDGCRLGQTRSQMRMIACQAGIYNAKDAKCAYANDVLMDMWDGCI